MPKLLRVNEGKTPDETLENNVAMWQKALNQQKLMGPGAEIVNAWPGVLLVDYQSPYIPKVKPQVQ